MGLLSSTQPLKPETWEATLISPFKLKAKAITKPINPVSNMCFQTTCVQSHCWTFVYVVSSVLNVSRALNVFLSSMVSQVWDLVPISRNPSRPSHEVWVPLLCVFPYRGLSHTALSVPHWAESSWKTSQFSWPYPLNVTLSFARNRAQALLVH